MFFFFFKYTATTEIYTYCHTLSLHDALPVSHQLGDLGRPAGGEFPAAAPGGEVEPAHRGAHLGDRLVAVGEMRAVRSEEHTSELQSLMRISYAVCCLKKKKKRNSP